MGRRKVRSSIDARAVRIFESDAVRSSISDGKGFGRRSASGRLYCRRWHLGLGQLLGSDGRLFGKGKGVALLPQSLSCHEPLPGRRRTPSRGIAGRRTLGFPPPDPMQDWFMRLSLDFQRLAENESISAIDHLASDDQFSMLPILRSKSTSRDQLFTVV